MVRAIHVIGRKNHGKTTLIVELVSHLARCGVRVGTVKHCGHEHPLEAPGKDSTRHRLAGAEPVAVITPGQTALYQRRTPDTSPYAPLHSHFSGCDVVIIEGDLDGPGPKLEVWRAAAGGAPLALERDDILGMVTDDATPWAGSTWSRRDVAAVAEAVQRLAREL